MTPTAGLVIEAWRDLDRATAGLSAEDAERRIGTASPISWTVAHVTQMVDSWLNVAFQGAQPHAFLSGDELRKGGAGDALDWTTVLAVVDDVRRDARRYLEAVSPDDIERMVPYTGSIDALRKTGFSPRYAMLRIAAHHYFHLGEIASARVSLGHEVGDYPGLLESCL